MTAIRNQRHEGDSSERRAFKKCNNHQKKQT